MQKLDIDFPDDRTTTKIDLKRSQLYEPGAAPAKPGQVDGEVARAVTAAELPDVDVSATPYGLTAQQQAVIKELYYGGFHYAGRDRRCAVAPHHDGAEKVFEQFGSARGVDTHVETQQTRGAPLL